jgi:hypothetical protein
MWYSSWYGEADFCEMRYPWYVPLNLFCFSSFSRFAPSKLWERRAPMIAFANGPPPLPTHMIRTRVLRATRRNRMAVKGKTRWNWPWPRETACQLFTSPAVVSSIRHCVRDALLCQTGFDLQRASDRTLRIHFQHPEAPLFHSGTEGGLL